MFVQLEEITRVPPVKKDNGKTIACAVKEITDKSPPIADGSKTFTEQSGLDETRQRSHSYR